ncbi:MAG TPA: RDD family protein [Acidimicrobiales bacterium]|nr:RDD family protein [Acidimicrobiales bacterium]HXR26312.1 RDD family protein [Candidatus Baltobacteraceae bacterium]
MGFQMPSAPQAGTASLVYADVPNRIIAYIIDVIILFVINLIVAIILTAVSLGTGTLGLGWLVAVVVGLAINAGYFIYTWTAMRGTIGMKALGMQIGNAGDGKTLTMDQAVKRWIYVGGWIAIASLITSVLGLLGLLLAIVALVYEIYLLYTTAQSPTKQGFHDIQAHTQVVKVTRSVA